MLNSDRLGMSRSAKRHLQAFAIAAAGVLSRLSAHEDTPPGAIQPEGEMETSRVRASFDPETSQDHSSAVQHVMTIFGPIIGGMPMAESEQRELLELLTNRTVAVWQARAALYRKWDEQRRNSPSTFSHSNAEIESIVATVRLPYDDRIRRLLRPELWDTVSQMIQLESEFGHAAR
jgi:hypothetical protein